MTKKVISQHCSCYLNRVEVGTHNDLVKRSGQLRGQLGFLLQTLGFGVVVQSGAREEIVDHRHAVVLPWITRCRMRQGLCSHFRVNYDIFFLAHMQHESDLFVFSCNFYITIFFFLTWATFICRHKSDI